MKKMILPLVAFLLLLLQACNLPSAKPVTPTMTPSLAAESPTATPTITDTPTPTATPQNPLVLRDTLCWIGPGPQYDVVSALKENTRVELIGRGAVTNWWVVTNPIYKDACWVQAADVQIEPGFDTSALKVINPPPTPTFTPTQTHTPTPTP